MNEVRIQEQMYITLKIDDKLRFGYDILQCTMYSNVIRFSSESLKDLVLIWYLVNLVSPYMYLYVIEFVYTLIIWKIYVYMHYKEKK